MEALGLAIGLIGIALAVYQGAQSRQNGKTIRRWGEQLTNNQMSSADQLARVVLQLREAGSTRLPAIVPEVIGTLDTVSKTLKSHAEEFASYIDTVAKP